MKRFFTVVFASAVCVAAYSTRTVRSVEGVYDYVVPQTVSLADARNTALERAMLQALADAFGTIVSSDTWTEIRSDNGVASTGMWSLGNSLVKGEWIETIGEPEFETFYRDETFVMRVRVKGKAREIASVGIPLSVTLLRNGTDSRFETREFVTGDNLFVRFSSPVAGYLAIYLADDRGGVFRMLPFQGQSETACAVSADREYLFFESQEGYCDRYRLYTSQKVERNVVYVVFSPEKFVRPIDKPGNGTDPRRLDFADFGRWLSAGRALDDKMQVVVLPINIVSETR